MEKVLSISSTSVDPFEEFDESWSISAFSTSSASSASSASSTSSASSEYSSFVNSPETSPKRIKDLNKDEEIPIISITKIPDPLLFCHAANITCVHEEDFLFASIIRIGLTKNQVDLILVSPTKGSCRMAGMLGFFSTPKVCFPELRPRKDFSVLKVPDLVNGFSSKLYPNIDFSLLTKKTFLLIDDDESEFQYLNRLNQFFYSEIPSVFVRTHRPSILIVLDRETSKDIHFVGTRLDKHF